MIKHKLCLSVVSLPVEKFADDTIEKFHMKRDFTVF